MEPEQWLQRHPEAGSSWPSWPQASQFDGALAGMIAFDDSDLKSILTFLTEHYVEIKSPFPIALICTTVRRIPARAGTNHGPVKRWFGSGMIAFDDSDLKSIRTFLTNRYTRVPRS